MEYRSGEQGDSFYADGAFYDLLYKQQQGDLEFYREQADLAGGPVLELACGTGRLTIPLAQHGFPIIGMDLSESMLDQARQKSPAQEWYCGDMRQFSLDKRFALIFVAFNSLQHLHRYEDVARLLECVTHHLLPGGKFIVDIFNPRLEMLIVPAEERRTIGHLEDPDGRGTIHLEEKKIYDRDSQVIHSTWYSSLEGLPNFRTTELALRCFFPQELLALLTLNGFTVEHRFGDFLGKPFGSEDAKQILICSPTSH